MSLETEFEERIQRQIRETERIYPPSVYIKMVSDMGAVAAAKRLIKTATPSGFTRMQKEGRLDLTTEAIIIDEPKWQPLFTSEEVNRAREVLQKCGYKFRDESKRQDAETFDKELFVLFKKHRFGLNSKDEQNPEADDIERIVRITAQYLRTLRKK